MQTIELSIVPPGLLFVDWVRKVEAGNRAAEACLEADDVAGARVALGAIPPGDELSSESLNGFAEVVTTEGTQSVADFKARSITALVKTVELYRIVRTKR
jgi:hypothetical protein